MTACTHCGWDSDRVPAHTWTAEIEAYYPSQNFLGNNGKTGYTYRRIRNNYSELLKDQLNSIPRATKFRAGIITRLYGKGRRAYDEENMVGGGKPLIDVLRDYAVITDDRPGCWRGYYRQERSPDGVDRIRVELLEYA